MILIVSFHSKVCEELNSLNLFETTHRIFFDKDQTNKLIENLKEIYKCVNILEKNNSQDLLESDEHNQINKLVQQLKAIGYLFAQMQI